MLSILFKSYLIRHSGTGRAFNNTQRALEHLKNLESTRAFGHSESTQRALVHSDIYGTWALGPLGHSGIWALKALRHFGN